MFPSNGLFSDTDCLYYETKECRRAYCHFRHAGHQEYNNEEDLLPFLSNSVQIKESITKSSHIPVNCIPQQPSSLRRLRYLDKPKPILKLPVVEYIPKSIRSDQSLLETKDIINYVPTSTAALKKSNKIVEQCEQNSKIENLYILNNNAQIATTEKIITISNENQPENLNLIENQSKHLNESEKLIEVLPNVNDEIINKKSISNFNKKENENVQISSTSNYQSSSLSKFSISQESPKGNSSKKKTEKDLSPKEDNYKKPKISSERTKEKKKRKELTHIKKELDDEITLLDITCKASTSPMKKFSIDSSQKNDVADEFAKTEVFENHLSILLKNQEEIRKEPTTIENKFDINDNYIEDSVSTSHTRKRIAHCDKSKYTSNSLTQGIKKFKPNLKETLYMRTISSHLAITNEMTPTTKNETRKSKIKKGAECPSILLPENSRLPYFERDQSLKTIIDECMNLYSDTDEAILRAQKEEKDVYEKCITVKVYKSAIRLVILKIRKEISAKVQSLETDKAPKNNTISKYSHHSSVNDFGDKENHNFIITVKSSSIALKTFKLDVIEFYEYLSQFIPSKQVLCDNNYPQPVSDDATKATIKNIQINNNNRNNRDRKCDRCSKFYKVNLRGFPERKEECIYHPLRRIMRKGEVMFACCSNDSSSVGCCSAPLHVSTGFDPNELCNYVRTLKPEKKLRFHGVYSLDCEMCYTTHGLELTRVTVIDLALNIVFDKLVKPKNQIIDYNTKFSGITAQVLKNATDSLHSIQIALLKMFSQETILIGHSLESDLKSLHLLHDKIVDTSLVFPHALGSDKKRALRTLAAEFLKKIIQNEASGHSSDEDAISCMELMLFKFLNKT